MSDRPRGTAPTEPSVEVMDPEGPKQRSSAGTAWLSFGLGLLAPVVVLALLSLGFFILRDANAPKVVMVLFAIVWGVGGVALLFWSANYFVEHLPKRVGRGLLPYVFVGPGVLLLLWFLAIPTLRTLVASLQDKNSQSFVGLDNYKWAFTDPSMLTAFRNNLMWVVVGSTLSVLFGLIVAVLADKSRFERTAKALIFLPMAISFVGAGVIWNFMYEIKPAGEPQIGVLNAIWQGVFHGSPQSWVSSHQPWNNLFLIAIVVWLQTGFAMVLFSAAIKGVPTDQLEAARVDGATEVQTFFKVTLPAIAGTVITVSTTVVIFTLKIFDVVWVMTGGQYGTDVIATNFFRQYFTYDENGRGSAIAIVLLIAVIPVMIYNLKQFGEREAF